MKTFCVFQSKVQEWWTFITRQTGQNWSEFAGRKKESRQRHIAYITSWRYGEKERDLTQSYAKSIYTIRKWKSRDNTETLQKSSITQRLRTDLGRSVVVTTVIRPVWLNQFTGSQPSHSPQKLCNQKGIHLKISK